MEDTETATAPPQQPIPTEDAQSTAMIPYQGDPQSVDVNAPDNGQAITDPDPQLTATIPSETAPNNPDIERQYHEAWWRHALDKVGTILGGDTTIHVTKDKDGNVTMTHDPSTTGREVGKSSSQQLSAEPPQDWLIRRDREDSQRQPQRGLRQGYNSRSSANNRPSRTWIFENKQLLAKANRIHLTQQTAMEAAQTRLENLKLDQATADVLNKNLEDYQGRPGAVDYGAFDSSDPNGVINLSKKNPGAMDDFLGKNNRKTAVVLEPDHKLHVIGYNGSDQDRWNDKPADIPYNDIDKNGKPIIATKPAGPGTHKQGELDLTRDAVQAEYLKRMGLWAKAQKDESSALKPEGEPKTLPEMNLAIERETDPVKKQQLISARDATVSQQKQLRTVNQVNVGTVAPGTTPESMIAPGGKFAPETVSGTNAQALASGDLLFDELPKRMAKGAATPQEMFAAASAYSKQLYGLGYSPTMISNEKKQFDNIKEQGILNGIDKMMGTAGQQGYLDLVVNLGKQAVGDGSVAPWNEISLAVKKKFGEQAAKNFNTALGEVQRSLPQLIGNPLLGGSDSDLKQRMASDMFGSDKTAGNLLSTAATLKGMLQGTTDSLTRNNRFLQRRYGLRGPYAAQFTPTQPGGGGATQQTQQTKHAAAAGTDDSSRRSSRGSIEPAAD